MMSTEWDDKLTQGTLKVSILMVMESAAGFYVGRACVETDEQSDDFCGGMHEPFIRDSGYYATEEAAQKALDDGFTVRDCIENN